MGIIKIYTDGASRNNPGHSGIGVVAFNEDNTILFEYKEYLGKKTNNEAEYIALLKAMEICVQKEIFHVDFFLDSQLVVEQIKGNYKVKKDHLKIYFTQIIEFTNKIKASFTYIPRAKNKKADKLANLAIDEFFSTNQLLK